MTSNEMTSDIGGPNSCNCGSGEPSFWISDGYGIPLCKVCPKCETSKRKRYRADIETCYECDEPIDSE